MNRFFLLTLVVALVMATGSMLRVVRHNHFANPNENVAHASDGAFQDGLYLGRLAAKSGAEPYIAVGRWATPKERTSFTSGYHQGYGEFLARRITPTTQEHRAE